MTTKVSLKKSPKRSLHLVCRFDQTCWICEITWLNRAQLSVTMPLKIGPTLGQSPKLYYSQSLSWQLLVTYKAGPNDLKWKAIFFWIQALNVELCNWLQIYFNIPGTPDFTHLTPARQRYSPTEWWFNDTEKESLVMWARIVSFEALYLNWLLNLIICVSVISPFLHLQLASCTIYNISGLTWNKKEHIILLLWFICELLYSAFIQ